MLLWGFENARIQQLLFYFTIKFQGEYCIGLKETMKSQDATNTNYEQLDNHGEGYDNPGGAQSDGPGITEQAGTLHTGVHQEASNERIIGDLE